MRDGNKKLNDFIVFTDDRGERRELWVEILKVDAFVTFKLTSGKIFILPPSRVIKIKREGDRE